MREDLTAARARMVDEQLVARGIEDERVLQAMASVPREAFLEEVNVAHAYDDAPLPIGFGQTMSQPYMVALIAQASAISPGKKILDVGTGSGYAAAVFAAAGADVHTIERIPELARAAERRLREAGYEVTVHGGDGSLGVPKEAPFGSIAVAAAAPRLPTTLYEQLVPGGRLVVPVGRRHAQRLEVAVRSPEGPALIHSVPCRFVPLVGAQGYRHGRG